jgi:5-methylcytosine-specific restriction endonuclease McrA
VNDIAFTLSAPRRRGGNRFITLEQLWQRDNGICWLCKDYVDLELDEPTRDHVIPYAQGGSDRPENLKLAHRECNEVRGNEPVTAIAAIMQNVVLRGGINRQI